MLATLGYDVVSVMTGAEALEQFRLIPERFDIVITDQTMPGMTGEALAHELRQIRPDIPIILCTGYSHSVNAERAAANKINAFCMKPLIAADLGSVIQQILETQGTP